MVSVHTWFWKFFISVSSGISATHNRCSVELHCSGNIWLSQETRCLSSSFPDFVTGLWCSSGNTVISTIIEEFSTSVHFVALPKLRLVVETAQFLTKPFFWLCGCPLDIVSSREPQLTSLAWKELCGALGAQTSLSFGFHPQINRQVERANQGLDALTSQPGALSCRIKFLNSTTNDFFPFKSSLGYQPLLFLDVEGEKSFPAVLKALGIHTSCSS